MDGDERNFGAVGYMAYSFYSFFKLLFNLLKIIAIKFAEENDLGHLLRQKSFEHFRFFLFY